MVALVRILLSAVVLYDWIRIYWLKLVVPLFAPLAGGGMGTPMSHKTVPWLYATFTTGADAAWMGFGLVVALTVMLGLGLFTRLSALALVLVWTQLALGLPASDRGIDMLIRNVVLLLAFSSAGRVWSIDAWIRTGSWRGDGQRIPAWPRYLVVIQLVILYFTAGIQKVSSSWTPFGGWSALYIAMRDPAFAMGTLPSLDGLYPATQFFTASTWCWEWSAPLLLLALYYRDTRNRAGRLRALMNRLSFRTIYLIIGASFHIGTSLTLQLGIFPWAILSLYPACFHPDEFHQMVEKVKTRLRNTMT
ncbi:MAG: HTTM domain-containing protein [Myxococcota bacterium]|nr:HTTM domain-containing protein [Myxococcota bacterium]